MFIAFCGVTLCSPVYMYQCCTGTCCLDHQGTSAGHTWSKHMVGQVSSAQTNSSKWNARKAVTMWLQVLVHYRITVSLPIRQYLSLHRVMILSGNNQLPFPAGSFTTLIFQRPAFAYTKACRKTPLMQLDNLLYFEDMLHYLCVIFHKQPSIS